jgi:hypothetical protein
VSRLTACIGVVAALVLWGGSPAHAQPAIQPRAGRLADVETFALALGSANQRTARLGRLAAYDLVVLDGIDAPRALVDGLRERGVVVLGYLSIGTIERGRPWSATTRPYRLDRWDDFDEWYADVAEPGFREIVTERAAPTVLGRGFDGLFLDNTDMTSSHPAQQAGMDTLVRALGRSTHGRDRLLFTQNGEDVIGPTLDRYDGWNREDVSSTYDFDTGRYARVPADERRAALASLRRIADAGLLVTATDYVAAGDRAVIRSAARQACGSRAIPFVSGIELDRVPIEPLRCRRLSPAGRSPGTG